MITKELESLIILLYSDDFFIIDRHGLRYRFEEALNAVNPHISDIFNDKPEVRLIIAGQNITDKMVLIYDDHYDILEKGVKSLVHER